MAKVSEPFDIRVLRLCYLSFLLCHKTSPDLPHGFSLLVFVSKFGVLFFKRVFLE